MFPHRTHLRGPWWQCVRTLSPWTLAPKFWIAFRDYNLYFRKLWDYPQAGWSYCSENRWTKHWTGQACNETSAGIQTWRKVSAPNLRRRGIEQRESTGRRAAWSRGSDQSTDWHLGHSEVPCSFCSVVWTVSVLKGPHIASLVLRLVLLGGSRSFRWDLVGFNREGGPSRGIVRFMRWTGLLHHAAPPWSILTSWAMESPDHSPLPPQWGANSNTSSF